MTRAEGLADLGRVSTSGTRIDDADRLVLGAAAGLRVTQVRVFVETLRASGYRGQVVILVRPTDRALIGYLRSKGVVTRAIFSVRQFQGPIHSFRFQAFDRYLRACGRSYAQILVSDVRDVAFQAHPFVGIDNPGVHFFLESASKRIGEEPGNRLWTRRFLGASVAEQLAPCRISCVGVVIGGGAAMADYLGRMSGYLRAVPFFRQRKIGGDTAFHNLMAHITREVDGVIVENNAHVATMALEPACAYEIAEDGRILRGGGAVPVLHQYDRFPAIAQAVLRRAAALSADGRVHISGSHQSC